MLSRILLCLIFLVFPSSESITPDTKYYEQEYYQMISMDHMDHYRACLSQPDNVYCMADFVLSGPDHNPMMIKIKEFSEVRMNFNHSIIKRAYCLNRREFGGINPENYELYVNNLMMTEHGLNAKLYEFNYCKTASDDEVQFDFIDKLFIFALGVIILFNIIGTVYDVAGKRLAGKDFKGSNEILRAWSIRYNVKKITSNSENTDLNPIQQVVWIRVFLTQGVIFSHVFWLSLVQYLHDPFLVESIFRYKFMFLAFNGSPIVSAFLFVSIFALCCKIVDDASNPKKNLNIMYYIELIIRRIIRIMPVYLFVYSFCGTLYRRIGSGPFWYFVEAEARSCRKMLKVFLTFTQNIAVGNCLPPTWSIASDMHQYIIVAVVMICIVRKKYAKKLLMFIILGSTLYQFLIAYAGNITPLMYQVTAGTIRAHFDNDIKHLIYYLSTTHGMATAFMAPLFAFIIFDIVKSRDTNCIKALKDGTINGKLNGFGIFTVPLEWILRNILLIQTMVVVSGYWLIPFSDWNLFTALHTVLERPIYVAMWALHIYAVVAKINVFMWKVSLWPGWQMPSRLSLGMFLVHWPITRLLLANHFQALDSSGLSIVLLYVEVTVLSYIVSFILEIAVQMPITNNLLRLQMGLFRYFR